MLSSEEPPHSRCHQVEVSREDLSRSSDRPRVAEAPMEMLIAMALLSAVALLAVRFGHDSRDGYESKERSLASYGMTWADTHAASATIDPRPADPVEEPQVILPVPLDPKPAAA